jgi:hypothetical protein
LESCAGNWGGPTRMLLYLPWSHFVPPSRGVTRGHQATLFDWIIPLLAQRLYLPEPGTWISCPWTVPCEWKSGLNILPMDGT